MKNNKIIKASLIAWIFAMAFVAGCADKNKGDNPKANDSTQVGAVEPSSVEAMSLLDGPWCLDQNYMGQAYENRVFFKESGDVIIQQFKKFRGKRTEQNGETETHQWNLKGNLLTYIYGQGKTQVNLSFETKAGMRYMTSSYDQGSDVFVGCP